MRLPFVSREAFETLQTAYKREVELTATLLEKYHGLRQAGSQPEASVNIPVVEEPPLILMKAIREVSPTGNDAAYAFNYRFAMGLKDEWKNEGAMQLAAEKIRAGSNPTSDE